jgi:hypothetical protein
MTHGPVILTAAALIVAAFPAPAQRVHHAAADGDLARLEAILSCDGDLVYATDSGGATPLHLAALEGHADVVELLLADGGSPNALDVRGFAPLHFAVLRSHVDVARLLLDAGADPNLRMTDSGATPLQLAVLADAFRGSTEMTEVLVAGGGRLSPTAAVPSWPSLMVTAYLAGNAPMVRLLHQFLPTPPESTAGAAGLRPPN